MVRLRDLYTLLFRRAIDYREVTGKKGNIYIYIMHAYGMQNQTSIRISAELLRALKHFKEERESYEDVIWDFIEPHLELSDEAKKDIKQSEKEYERGEVFTLEEIEEKYGF